MTSDSRLPCKGETLMLVSSEIYYCRFQKLQKENTMSDPFKEARERDERWQELQRKFDEAQRQEKEEIARANSLRQQNQEQEAKRILTAIGAREKLDYIRQSVWKCGQILDYGRLG